MNDLLKINSEQEKQKIVNFLKDTFQEQKIDHAVIGLSGGIDSMTSFYLLKEVLPIENIHVAHLYYFNPNFSEIEKVLVNAKVPLDNIHNLSIKDSVDAVLKLQNTSFSEVEKVRAGNIMARMRMIVLFDLSKKYNALVCGTENKTENLLSYFTRFGDQASDIEPIEHLYKTQVFALAKYLGIPEIFITQKPSAGLWEGQTDEGQFGFSYEEADQVLFLALEDNKSLKEIEEMGFKNAKKILDWREKNLFKHQVPYTLE